MSDNKERFSNLIQLLGSEDWEKTKKILDKIRKNEKEKIYELSDILADNDQIESIEYDDFISHIKISKKSSGVVYQPVSSAADGLGMNTSFNQPYQPQVSRQTEESNKENKSENSSEQVKDDSLYEVKSPMVGVFYRAPSPTSPPYVEENKKINKGDVIAIIEAMKIMNEIESEISGTIVEILVENAQPVEYGQPLYKVKLD